MNNITIILVIPEKRLQFVLTPTNNFTTVFIRQKVLKSSYINKFNIIQKVFYFNTFASEHFFLEEK